MEVSALQHRTPALRGTTPFLRIQSDERLVALTRRGNQAAFETLVARYQSRLQAFCRHMLRSREDAEDVLQEVFAASFNALLGDNRPINVRPWLYRIARNRCLNHLRRQTAIGVDSMDIHLADNGASTADRVHQREEFRQLVSDVQELAETQRTALLLREIDALSYDQIAEAMETTVPAVKSLLVRARVGLAEATEARRLSCEDVRIELGEVAEGLKRKSPAVRRHARDCERCSEFSTDLRSTNKALAAMFPVGPLLVLKKFLVTHGATQAAAGSATAGAGAAGAAAATAGTGSAITAGVGVLVTKATAGLAAAALVTAGAVEVGHVRHAPLTGQRSAAAAHVAPGVAPAPRVVATTPQPSHPTRELARPVAKHDSATALPSIRSSTAGKPLAAPSAAEAPAVDPAAPVVTAITTPVETTAPDPTLANGSPELSTPPTSSAQPAAGTAAGQPSLTIAVAVPGTATPAPAPAPATPTQPPATPAPLTP